MALYDYIEGRDDGLGVPKNVILRCSCVDRCELEVERQKGDCITDDQTGKQFRFPDEYTFVFKSKAINNNLNMLDALKVKIKKIWYILRGKDYTYYDIVVGEKAMKDFVKALQKLTK